MSGVHILRVYYFLDVGERPKTTYTVGEHKHLDAHHRTSFFMTDSWAQLCGVKDAMMALEMAREQLFETSIFTELSVLRTKTSKLHSIWITTHTSDPCHYAKVVKALDICWGHKMNDNESMHALLGANMKRDQGRRTEKAEAKSKKK